jgi:hypothetical protein
MTTNLHSLEKEKPPGISSKLIKKIARRSIFYASQVLLKLSLPRIYLGNKQIIRIIIFFCQVTVKKAITS